AEGRLLLHAAAERADPGRRVVMLAEATAAGFHAGDAAAMLESSRLAEEAAPEADGSAAVLAELARGMALVFSGEGEAGAARIRRAMDVLGEDGLLESQPRLLHWALTG